MKISIDKRAYGSILNFSRIIYKNAIINREDIPEKDNIVDLYYKNKFVAQALYVKGSSCIKILTLKKEDIDRDFFYRRIKKAIEYREDILGFKDTYRMIYAEGDYLPSVVLDKYNNIGSMQLSSKIMEKYATIIYECVEELTDISALHVQGANKGDSIKSKIYGDKNNMETIIKEGNGKFKVNVKGHKTGFFLDQRDNRIDVEKYIREGDRVLDICCYTGGFSVHCGIKGAEVLGVDISKKALGVAKENMELNNIKNYHFIEGNAFDVMRELIEEGESFDVVILDPPAFAKTFKDVKNALKAYNTMNYLGLKLAKRMLITCSCSHHVDREMFKNTIISSSLRAKKEIKQIGGYRTQSPDHVITMANKNLEYLKCLFFGIE
ncbi:MAG TPA: class I SAM-dependent rRNA methyltransferase [Methanothermococcus okinawensis]|uniref:Class I SAM-dependent rRNA methyltransferase n=1 Tax=Methanothermococcus okinawensis TaxID=155863 RepID=A0A832YTS5_9EURY|nr:class I SAM-dependent rRNA methyltransferase [Methanothermococcus okinawensis]